jgi:hypothetical protein
LTNASDTTCACAATLRDAPDCYPCVKQNDPSIGPSLDARVAYCQSLNMSTASGSSAPSHSASVTASQSAVATFSSDASTIDVTKRSEIVGIVGFLWFVGYSLT